MLRRGGASQGNRYARILETVFFERYRQGAREVEFARADLERVAAEQGIALPKNLGDVIYSFRYRNNLPDSILATAPQGETWIIRPAGRSLYKFALSLPIELIPNPRLIRTKIPDATPGVIVMYALGDEQSLLAKLRYNSLIDLFLGIKCYSLQSHLRTHVKGMGQVETDEIYVGIDRWGAQFVIPVQAKGGTDKLNIVQIEQDVAMCDAKFPNLACRPVAAQFMGEDVIALFECEVAGELVQIRRESHYQLVKPDEITEEELVDYWTRSFDSRPPAD